jgi:hypothetical protein
MFKFWQDSFNLRGLPIGLQASSVVSNFFLNPVDRSLAQAGLLHRRYGDDMLIFTENTKVNTAGVALLDNRLNDLQLRRSVPKTNIFDDPDKAKANLRDLETDYLASCQRIPGVDKYVLKRSFDRDILNAQTINGSRLRYLLKVLKGKGQRYGTLDLVRRFDIMNIDPKNTTDYLISPKPERKLIDICMNQISQPSTLNTEAITLHYLRLMSQTRCGQAEAKIFAQIAENNSRIGPTREWAWVARFHADGTKRSFVMEAAREEADPHLRRAMMVSLKGAAYSPKIKSFLAVAKAYPDSRPTVEWVLSP